MQNYYAASKTVIVTSGNGIRIECGVMSFSGFSFQNPDYNVRDGRDLSGASTAIYFSGIYSGGFTTNLGIIGPVDGFYEGVVADYGAKVWRTRRRMHSRFKLQN